MTVTLQADYVIVGGGSAGCLLANRLSADPGTQVILVEAGGKSDSFMVDMPAGMARLIANPKADWCYLGEPDASLNGRRFLWSAGKMLGGGSSINGQVYIRGQRRDYQRWVEAGCSGWSFDELLPYFKQGERYQGEPMPESHGRDGELSVSPIRSPHALLQTFIDACEQIGVPPRSDYCGGEQFGAFATLATQRGGLRCSSAKAYLEPVRGRTNLRVITGAKARAITWRGARATGVDVVGAKGPMHLGASAEVLVCAGTIGSPSLLMRSGVGPGSALAEMGIPVVVDAAELGGNLQEHPGVSVSKWVNVPTFNSQGALQIGGEMLRFLTKRRGMLTTPAVQGMAFVKTQDGLADPDVQLHFLPLTYEVTPETLCSASAKMPKRPAMMLMTNVCQPFSRGRIRLRSPDVDAAPLIDHRMIGDERDVATLVRACRFAERVFGAPVLQGVVDGSASPPSPMDDEAGWVDYVRNKVVPCYHPVGTCRMGGDAGSVVDPQLRLRGAQNLRVVDASVMPNLPSANTNAATMMIAEKAAAMILAAGRQMPRSESSTTPEGVAA